MRNLRCQISYDPVATARGSETKTTKAPPLVKSDGAPVERVTLLVSALLV